MLSRQPLFTESLTASSDFRPLAHSLYIYGRGEERSEHVTSLSQGCDTLHMVQLVELERPIVQMQDGSGIRLSMRRTDDVKKLISYDEKALVYIDMTGLSHHVWAPLLKVALECGRQIKVVYVEPVTYAQKAAPRKGDIFDLSEKFDGIEPLPQFSRLSEPSQQKIFLLPLLGFEGARLSYVLEQIEADGQNIFPIVGVPGFELHYPFHAFQGNQNALLSSKAWKNVLYTRANCAFSLFYLLERLLIEYREAYFKIATIGTKPHALGAILAGLCYADRTEIVYDNPKRKGGRTSGASKCIIYHIDAFIAAGKLCAK